MAGRPKKRAMVMALERRTREHFDLEEGKTVVDYVVDWVESGRSILALAGEISEDEGLDITRSMLSTYVNSQPGGEERLRTARVAEAPRAMVEEARQIIDDADTSDREKLQKAKMRADVRLWQAERVGKEEFGQAKQGIQVNVSVGGLHMDALRHRTTATITIDAEEEQLALPAGDEVEAELLD